MTNIKMTALALGAVVLSASPLMAGERTAAGNHANTVNVDINLPYGNAQIDTFAEADMNSDGNIVFKEFQTFAQLDNEYNRFLVLDTDGDKRLSKNEFYSLDEAANNYNE